RGPRVAGAARGPPAPPPRPARRVRCHPRPRGRCPRAASARVPRRPYRARDPAGGMHTPTTTPPRLRAPHLHHDDGPALGRGTDLEAVGQPSHPGKTQADPPRGGVPVLEGPRTVRDPE